MSKNNKPQRDWVDVGLRLLTPIFAGILIAWAGFVSDMSLTSISSKQESARLITELQISREQAESELRKDVFDQTLQAFLIKDQEHNNSIRGMSKQILRLELLALNFGDALSMSPLFSELREDLKKLRPVDDSERPTFDEDKGELRKRLDSLARRVASNQISSLAQQGVMIKISIPLIEYKRSVTKCDTYLYENAYTWPENDIKRQFGIYNDDLKELMTEEMIKEMFADKKAIDLYKKTYNESRLFELHGIKRYLDISISNIDHCDNRAKVTIILYKEKNENNNEIKAYQAVDKEEDPFDNFNAGLEESINRSFKLDYFNFPMVDNTRLSNNHRFAIVLEDFDLKSSDPSIELVGIVFPSEYASLRDRPGMKEARKLLESALK